jgi:hypothetical protein
MSSEVRLIHGRRERKSDEPLHRGVYLLPNLITTCGLFSGFYSIIATIDGSYQVAAICILVAHVFDGLDGRIARLTKSTSSSASSTTPVGSRGVRRGAGHPGLQVGARAVGQLGLARRLVVRRVRRLRSPASTSRPTSVTRRASRVCRSPPPPTPLPRRYCCITSSAAKARTHIIFSW